MEILSLGLVDLTQYRRSSIVAARGQSKRPDEINSPGLLFWRRPTLAQPIVALPSGLQRFTSVFGMGTGGATALLSPEGRGFSNGDSRFSIITARFHVVSGDQRPNC